MKQEIVTLAMGGGGRLSQELVEKVFLSVYGNEILNNLDDSAELHLEGNHIAFTTDSYTVTPPFFPGGDIGILSVCGTVNDLAAKGAKPVALSAGFIIEEGFLIDDVRRIAQSMQKTARELNVTIVTGDTKIVNKGDVDGIFINTSGIGIIMPGMNISAKRAEPGDMIILTGTIGEHGISILNVREELGFTPEIKSDVAPVFPLVEKIALFSSAIHVMRDPTRGGVASVLNEIAKASKVIIKINERAIPIKEHVRQCSDLLGMDPLYLANEGKLLLFVEAWMADDILQIIRSQPNGKGAVIIGTVEGKFSSNDFCPVYLETIMGAKRFIPLLEGDLLPRIC
jgi:hydrogenase expression/formation protein HypE